MLASRTFWYSGVSGACCPRPQGLVGSNAGWPPTPGMRTPTHWPHRSGYFASSNARTTDEVATSANPIAPSTLRYCMVFLLVIDFSLGLPLRLRQRMSKRMLLGEPKKEPAEEEAPDDGTPVLPVVSWELGTLPAIAACCDDTAMIECTEEAMSGFHPGYRCALAYRLRSRQGWRTTSLHGASVVPESVMSHAHLDDDHDHDDHGEFHGH